MSTPVGVFVGQGVGVPVEFGVKDGIRQRTYSAGMASGPYSRGAAVKRTTNEGEVDAAGTADVIVAGVLGQDVYDPAGIPAQVAENIFADGILTFSQIGQPTSVWTLGEFFVTQVSGTVAYGDFMKPYDGGLWASNGATNTLLNGFVICTKGNNSVSGGAIQIAINLT